MKRYMILKGDKTTADGVVLEGDETTTNAGRPLAYQGAAIYCPACKSQGRIVRDGPHLPMSFLAGKQVALDNDLCVCKCDPPPRLIASRQDMSMSFESHVLAQMGYAPDGTRLPAEQWRFIAFKVNDVGSLEGLGCTAYFDDGSTAAGVFDYENVVRFEQPTGSMCNRVTLEAADNSRSGTFAGAFLSTITA